MNLKSKSNAVSLAGKASRTLLNTLFNKATVIIKINPSLLVLIKSLEFSVRLCTVKAG